MHPSMTAPQDWSAWVRLQVSFVCRAGRHGVLAETLSGSDEKRTARDGENLWIGVFLIVYDIRILQSRRPREVQLLYRLYKYTIYFLYRYLDRFRGTNGKISSCRVVVSSGHCPYHSRGVRTSAHKARRPSFTNLSASFSFSCCLSSSCSSSTLLFSTF